MHDRFGGLRRHYDDDITFMISVILAVICGLWPVFENAAHTSEPGLNCLFFLPLTDSFCELLLLPLLNGDERFNMRTFV